MKQIFSLVLLSICSLGIAQKLELKPYATGLNRPTDIKTDGSSRLFVTEQPGTIRIVEGENQVRSQAFLNIRNKVLQADNEQGLLGIAFHPNYESNGFFYVNYTRRKSSSSGGETVVARYRRTSATQADPNSEVILVRYDQPATNHNGGYLEFGPDGMLYIGSGDGGSGGDAFDNGQNKNTLLGAILRLDVDLPAPYIPSDNPFVNQAGRDEIWAYGLRNPWKFSFDSQGNIWIGDVGDNIDGNPEEISKLGASVSGANYGWPCYEGNTPFKSNQCSGQSGLTFPIFQYPRNNGRCSVTGGRVYEGSTYPGLEDKYIFADYCTSELFMIDQNGNGFQAFAPATLNRFVGLSSFGVNADKELFAVGSRDGYVYQVIDSEQTLSTTDLSIIDKEIFQNTENQTVTLQGFTDADILNTSLISISGQKIATLSSQMMITDNTFSTSTLAPGIYILAFSETGNAVWSRKIIVR